MEDIASALEAAKKSLAEQKRAVLCDRINAACEDYLAERENETRGPKASHQDIAKQLNSIIKKATALAKAAGFADQRSELEGIARSRLEQIANVYAKEIGGYPGLDPVTAKHGAPRMNYRGDERLSAIFGELKLLEQLARRIHKAELTRVGRTGKKTDFAREALIYGVINAWKEAIGEKPTFSVDRSSGEVGGSFIRFVQTLPARLPKSALRLIKALTLSPEALRDIDRGRKYHLGHGDKSR